VKTPTGAAALARTMGVAEDLVPTATEAFLRAANIDQAKAAFQSIETLQRTTKPVSSAIAKELATETTAGSKKTFGTPAETRTRILSLERSGSSPLTYGDNGSIPRGDKPPMNGGTKPSSAKEAVAKGLTEEQFVKGQQQKTQSIFHATTEDNVSSIKAMGIRGDLNKMYFASDSGVTKQYGKGVISLPEKHFTIIPANGLKAKEFFKSAGIDPDFPHLNDKLIKILKDDGYDGLKYQTSADNWDYEIFNKEKIARSLKQQEFTTSQLRTEYQTAKGTLPKANSAQQAIKDGLTEEQFVKGQVKEQLSATQYGDYKPELRKFGAEDYTPIIKLGVKPDEIVKIYRGIDDIKGNLPRKINNGDFVTTDFNSALSYAGSPKDVVSMEVKAKYLSVSEAGDFKADPFYTGSEYIYTKEIVSPKTTSQLRTEYQAAKALSKPTSAKEAVAKGLTEEQSWSKLQKENPDLFNTGILRKSQKPQNANGVIPEEVHTAQTKWQNYGQDSEVSASILYEKDKKYGGYIKKDGDPVRDSSGNILDDIYDDATGRYIEPTVSNKHLRDNLLDSFSTKEGKQYLKEVVNALPKNSDGTITAYRIGAISKEGTQSYTLSEGMAKTFSNQGAVILPAGTPGLPKGGYKDFGVLPANTVKIKPEGIVAWSPYDAEILVESKYVEATGAKQLSPVLEAGRAPAVLHILSPNGEHTIQAIHPDDYEAFKGLVDRPSSGGKDYAQALQDKTGNSYHISATSPSQMTEAGAKTLPGYADLKAIAEHAGANTQEFKMLYDGGTRTGDLPFEVGGHGSPKTTTAESLPAQAPSQTLGSPLPEQPQSQISGQTAGRAPKPSQPQTQSPSVNSSYLKATTDDVKKLASVVDKSINVDRLTISDEGKKLITETVDEVKPLIEDAVGKPLTNKEAMAFSEETGKLLSRTVGREQTLEWEAAMLTTRKKLAFLAETGTVDKEFIDTLMTVKTLGTDLGRKLQSLSIAAEPGLQTNKQAIVQAVLKVTNDTEAVIAAAKGVDFTDFRQSTEFYRQFIHPQKREWLDLLRYNSMLSSPKTHIINTFSNLLNTTLMVSTEKIVVGQIDFLRSAITGTPRQRLSGEAGAMLKGYFSNVGEASKRFGGVMQGKIAPTNLDTRHIPLATKGLPAVVEKALSVPLRFLEGSDQFFTALSEAGERASIDYLASHGIKVPLAGKRVSEEAAYRVFRQDLHAEGQGTVLDAIDTFTSKVMQLREAKNPIVSTVAKFTVPFVKTPMNILKQGIENSPLGFATMIHAKDPQTQLARALIGSSIFAGAAILLTADRLTWSEPLNADQKNAFRDAGKQAYSVKIGDAWISYQKLPPGIAFPLSMVAMLHDGIENRNVDDTTVELVLTGIAKVGQFVADQSYARSIGDLLAAAKGGGDGVAKVAANYTEQLIPYRALSGWLARLMDDVQRQPDRKADFIEQEVQHLMTQIPGLSRSVPARENAQGKPISQQNPVLNAFSPLNVTNENPQKTAEYGQALEIKKINKQTTAKSSEFKQEAETTWGDLKDLPKAEMKAKLKEMAAENPDLVKKVLDVAADEKQGLSYAERQLKNAKIETRAQFIASQKATFKTDAEWKSYLKDLAAKKILTSDVLERMVELKR